MVDFWLFYDKRQDIMKRLPVYFRKIEKVLYFFTHSLKWEDIAGRNQIFHCFIFNSTYYKLELIKI